MHLKDQVTRIKKTYFHPKADEVLRKEFQGKIEKYQEEGKVIVYIDESGFAQDMPREYGYSKKGKRCYDEKYWHAKGRINAIGAIINNKLLTVSLFDSNIDSDVFYTWLEKDLIPKLPEESIIVMDNATFHKRLDMQEIIQNNNHTLLYLPPYSPDLNPIEKKWSEAKSIRRKERCSVENLFINHMEYISLQ